MENNETSLKYMFNRKSYHLLGKDPDQKADLENNNHFGVSTSALLLIFHHTQNKLKLPITTTDGMQLATI